LRTPSAARSSRQTCSTSRPIGLARPVVAGQFMWLSTINGRPERRSDDGRMILRAARAGQKLRLDLLFCGAPLRNRTVDLLLTIWTFLSSLPNAVSARPAAAAGPARIGTCGRPENMPTARDSLRESRPANGRIMGIRHVIQAQSVRLSPARPCLGRRSDDGQTILLPVRRLLPVVGCRTSQGRRPPAWVPQLM
jgi:hypothetical protein